MFTCLYGDGLLRGRRYAEALEALDQALDIGRQTGERWWESRIHHLRGEALLHSGDADSAVESLQMAIQVARAQQAKSWELRAATRLARLWAEQGKREDSRDLLAPVYGWFTEGFDTSDLKDAKALLEQLS
jgi:predicted ATPase